MSWLDELRRLLSRARRESPAPEGPAAMDCVAAMERLFEWLDGELETGEAEHVAQHFQMCANCYPHLTFEQAFREALRRAGEGDDRFPDSVRGQILAALEADGFAPPKE